jgi:hypothetical protein
VRYRTTKNNLQGLSFSLGDALSQVTQVFRSLCGFEAAKGRAAKARVHLRFIKTFISTLQGEVDALSSPTFLIETTVIRVMKMMVLEEEIRESFGLLQGRLSGSAPSEKEAGGTSELFASELSGVSRLCT